LRVTAIDLVTGIIEQLEEDLAERGRLRLPAAEVVATLQFFLREGVQWRVLLAGTGRASGSTLCRRLREWRDVPNLHLSAATVVGRGISIWAAVQSLSQLVGLSTPQNRAQFG
jgi:hypothetical protein